MSRVPLGVVCEDDLFSRIDDVFEGIDTVDDLLPLLPRECKGRNPRRERVIGNVRIYKGPREWELFTKSAGRKHVRIEYGWSSFSFSGNDHYEFAKTDLEHMTDERHVTMEDFVVRKTAFASRRAAAIEIWDDVWHQSPDAIFINSLRGDHIFDEEDLDHWSVNCKMVYVFFRDCCPGLHEPDLNALPTSEKWEHLLYIGQN